MMSGDCVLETVGKGFTNAGENGASKIALGSSTVDDGLVMIVYNGGVVDDDRWGLGWNHFQGKYECQQFRTVVSGMVGPIGGRKRLYTREERDSW